MVCWGYDEDGQIEEEPDAKYWWFPDYQVIDELRELLRNGVVFFEAATENKSK